MSAADVFAVVKRILVGACDVEEEVLPDSDLQHDLELDSVGILTLLVELETHFEAVFDDTSANPPQTVQGVVDLIVATMQGREGAGTPA